MRVSETNLPSFPRPDFNPASNSFCSSEVFILWGNRVRRTEKATDFEGSVVNVRVKTGTAAVSLVIVRVVGSKGIKIEKPSPSGEKFDQFVTPQTQLGPLPTELSTPLFPLIHSPATKREVYPVMVSMIETSVTTPALKARFQFLNIGAW
jgi:hypothetical protein